MVFLMETMIDAKRLQTVRDKCGFSEGLCLSSVGLSGGIGFWWSDLNINVISYSVHHVAVEVRDDDGNGVWAAVGIYGWPEASLKHLTWALMKDLRDAISLPIIFFGDFNEILHASEKEGGAVRGERQIDAFRDSVELCGLSDLGCRGGAFTWQRGNDASTMIRERLDRFLACDRWGNLFPQAWVKNFPIYKSDHAPILLCSDSGQLERRKGNRYHFEAMWLGNADCHKVVQQAWGESGGARMVDRIDGCASALKGWAAATFGDVKKRIKHKEEELQVWQNKVPDGRMLGRCKEIVRELDDLNRLHESYWHARARANEMRDGDKNTSYFHHKASQRKKRNTIHKLKDSEGVLKTDEKEVSTIISEYFTTIFSSSNPSNAEDALAGLSPKISNEANEALVAEPREEEIRDALFQMHPNKAPGVDGMHALFYQKFWHIVGDDIVQFIREWWLGRVQIDSMNQTCIVLIPKCSNPQQMGDFRPISLCTVLYKIISKMMANRLKIFLSDLISLHQSAFVPGRLITDNAMVAFEIFHRMKRGGDGRNGVMAFKLDMSKAYDRVEWSFLEKVMRRLGFCEGWVRRIMECLSSVSYSFKLNGRVEGNIIPSRGLRQGDPLSPYLFLLCAEAFSALLSKAAGDGLIHGARVCRSAPRISHLFFADDSILFTRATLQECSVVADILSTYERASGQKINFDKSEVSFSKSVDDRRKNEIRSLFGVREVERHEKYLGLPTVIGRSKKMVFMVLKERVWKKLQGWKEKLLSRAGKEVLLKAVIQAIPTYMMSLFAIPECILSEINSMCARFWWGARGTERKMHWVSWEKLCLPKVYGGMGFRDLRVFNQALLAKQGWRLMCDTNSMAHHVLRARYYPRTTFLSAMRGFDPSYVWRSIWGAKSLLMEGLKWRVGDGGSIGVWEDSWLPGDSASVVPTPNLESPVDLRVSDLFDENGAWNEVELHTHFTDEDIRLIREIPLSSRKPPDVLYWWPTVDGFFSTKSAYWLGRLGHLRGWLGRFGDVNGEVWKVIWGLDGPPKLKHFVWRACMGALATRGRLKDRHILATKGAASIVAGRMSLSLMPFSARLEKNDLLSFLALAWAAWSYRNSVTFEEPWLNVQVRVMGFLKLVSEYKNYAASVYRAEPAALAYQSRARWVAPSEGCFRLNTDAAMLADGIVGVGAVVRDSTGKVLLVAVRRFRARWSVALAEAMGARFGMEMAKRFGYGSIELECDASNIPKAIAKKSFGRSPTDLVLEDISILGNSLSSFSFLHVKRSGNTVAHFIARLYPADGVQHVYVSDFPQGVLALAELDVS
ncbi:uncharacterized protein LOC125493714 [Beta vulgaris subsp. vulgaris]|uniref:uncharacterized protein LOC125493714 n=1 Tax=Beta vulgaris subsp. vulgaris TaxID=3555 RepID=UPI002546E220|nr:uncharacterized protein LOC125493714 [Beta vulgaris subsp. vulgaris]